MVATAQIGTSPIFEMPVSALRPATVNDAIYKPVRFDDPSILELADDIRRNGLLDPIVITLDDVILAGHCRRAACIVAGKEAVSVRRRGILSTDPAFVPLLVSYNKQRVKSADEVFREELVRTDPDDAHGRLVSHRVSAATVKVDTVAIEGVKRRAEITRAKYPFLDAIKRVLEDRRNFWPLSDRAIHYGLLNDPPRMHASKPASVYRNDEKSYKSLCELLTRARLAGEIPFSAIADPTRPVSNWDVHRAVQGFIRGQLDEFLTGYYRDLQQSQPLHIEIVGEKNTVQSVISPVAAEFCIPYTIGRGYSSLPPRHEMARRFDRTGKDRLLLLFLSDFDPEGENIPHSFARSMRDDFGVEAAAVKVALTSAQVRDMGLPQGQPVKVKSSRAGEFIRKYGRYAYELEAIPPDVLQRMLRDAITSVIDIELYNAEVERERQDAAELVAVRNTILRSVPDGFQQ